MNPLRRASWALGLLGVFVVATTAFAPPFIRPPAPPPVIRPPTIMPPTYRPPSIPTIRPPTTGLPPSAGRITLPGGIRLPNTLQMRTTTHVTAEVRGLITKTPSAALPRLATAEARMLLPESTRITLGKEAVTRLAIQVETGGNPVRVLTEVRAAANEGTHLPGEVRKGLENVTRLAERRVLSESLDQVRFHAERGQWAKAGRSAREWRNELVKNSTVQGNRETPEFQTHRIEVLEALQKVEAIGQKLEALDSFQSMLKNPASSEGANGARQTNLEPSQLPRSLQPHAEALRGFQELNTLTSQKWSSPPNTVRLEQALARVERGMVELANVDPKAGKGLGQELAVRAYLEGHPEAYFKLMPKGGSQATAKQLLRDLKATTLGEGKVETPVVKSALAPEAGEAGTPPPGVEPLIPEGARQGWRPPARESARADLPPFEQAREATATIKNQAKGQIPRERSNLEGQAHAARANLGQVHSRVMAPDLPARQRFAELEAELDRRLRAEERVRARAWFEQGKATADMVAQLKGQSDAEDEEGAFLASVEKRLARPLAAGEKEQAKRLRRQGRTAAEVADILRS